MISDTITSDALAPVDDILRGILAIVDPRVPTAAVAATLADLLPTMRIDVLLNIPLAGSLQPFLTVGDACAIPPPAMALANDASFAQWLAELGYQTVERFPMIDTTHLVGWFMLSYGEGALHAALRPLVVVLANAFVLRHMATRREIELHAARKALSDAEARLDLTEQLQQQAAFAIGAVHDLNNLLAVIVGHIQLLHQHLPPSTHDDLWAIACAAQDGSLIIRRVLARDHAQVPSTPPLTLVSSAVQEALKLTQPFWERYGRIAVTTDLAPVPPVQAEPTEIREVLVNLILNAIAAMPEGGNLNLRSRMVHGEVIIEVTDTGTGIAREHHAAIFEPLKTTRVEGGGLGLTVSRAIVERAGGALTVDSAPEQGTTFTVTLPAAPLLDP